VLGIAFDGSADARGPVRAALGGASTDADALTRDGVDHAVFAYAHACARHAGGCAVGVRVAGERAHATRMIAPRKGMARGARIVATRGLCTRGV
jgi:hypothetical protein